MSLLNDGGTPFSKTDDQWQTYRSADGLTSSGINTIVVDGANRKWIGTQGGGLSLSDDGGTLTNPTDDRWQTLTATDGIPADIVYSVVIDSAGRKWIGGHEYRLAVWDDKGTPFDKTDDQWGSFATADGLSGIVTSITIDGAGRKWLSTSRGIVVLDDKGTPFNKTDDQWISFTTYDVNSGWAFNLVIDAVGRKWFGTQNGGVKVLDDGGTPFNTADDSWGSFTAADGLANNRISSLAIDSRGRKWFATFSGVSVLDDGGTPFDKTDDRWASFTTADGLANNYVRYVLVDRFGRKWFATDGGLSVLDDKGDPFNKANHRWTTYTTADGLVSNQVSCLAFDGQDQLWIGTQAGISVLRDTIAPAITSSATAVSGRLSPGDTTTYPIVIDTRGLPAGPYTRTITIRTSDPEIPTRTLQVFGNIVVGPTPTPTPAPWGQPDISLATPDVAFGTSQPVEGANLPITATLRNTGGQDTGGLAVSFIAKTRDFAGTYVGSTFVPNVPANGITTTTLGWNTLGFAGPVTMTVVADPFERTAERKADRGNNTTTTFITVTTRPDLRIGAITLSDGEPVVSQTVTVTVDIPNTGQTALSMAGQTSGVTQTVALSESYPITASRQLVQQLPAVVGASITSPVTSTVSFTWTPAATGWYRLYLKADKDGNVNESDKSNNEAWRDVYVGFPGALVLEPGAADDQGRLIGQVYTTTLGYGWVDEGYGDVAVPCAGQASGTVRLDPGGRVVARFDHLQPGRFYHLDLALAECDGVGRQQSVLVDGNPIAGPEDLSDQRTHGLSLRLDPALYADRAISVTVAAAGIDGAVVRRVALRDVDYRYVDAGSAADRAYSAAVRTAEACRGGGEPNPLTPFPAREGGTVDKGRAFFPRGVLVDQGSSVSSGAIVHDDSPFPARERGTVDKGGSFFPRGVLSDEGSSFPSGPIVHDDSPFPRREGGRGVRFSPSPTCQSSTLRPHGWLNGVASTAWGAAPWQSVRVNQITDTVTYRFDGLDPNKSYQVHLTFWQPSGTARVQQVKIGGQVLATVDTGDYLLHRLTLEVPRAAYQVDGSVVVDIVRTDGKVKVGAFVGEIALEEVTLTPQSLPLAADFAAEPTSGPPPLDVVFTNASTGSYTSSLWDFGDGITATMATSSFTYTYNMTGTYTVTLTVFPESGASDTVTRTNLIAVGSALLPAPPAFITLTTGWNLVSLPVSPTAPLAAEEFLRQISAGPANAVARWVGGRWETHVRGIAANNFPIEPGVAYFVNMEKPGTLTAAGRSFDAPPPVRISSGWSMIALPFNAGVYTAGSVLQELTARGVDARLLARWQDSQWQVRGRDLGGLDFPIEPGRGYFVRTIGYATWVPSRSPLWKEEP